MITMRLWVVWQTWPWVLILTGIGSSRYVNGDVKWYDMPEDDIPEDKWIDPLDMLGDYEDRVNQAKYQSSVVYEEKEEACQTADPDIVCQAVEEELQRCRKAMTEHINDHSCTKDCPKECQGVPAETYFRQFVSTFLQGFSQKMPVEGDTAAYRLDVQLSSDDMKMLTKYTKESSTIGEMKDAHHVLTTMIQKIKQIGGIVPPTIAEKIEAIIGIPLLTLCQLSTAVTVVFICIILLSRLHISLYQMGVKLFIAVFVISLPWTGLSMYQKKMAERYAENLKEIPAECKPNEMSVISHIWFSIKSSVTVSGDPCVRYQEKLTVNPLLEIPPTQVLAVTLTTFLLEPFKHVGKALSDTIRALLEDLPPIMYPIAIGLLFLIFVMLSGYKLHLFHMIGLEPPARVPAAPVAYQQQERLAGPEPVVRPLPKPETLRAIGEVDSRDTGHDVNHHAPDTRAPAPPPDPVLHTLPRPETLRATGGIDSPDTGHNVQHHAPDTGAPAPPPDPVVHTLTRPETLRATGGTDNPDTGHDVDHHSLSKAAPASRSTIAREQHHSVPGQSENRSQSESSPVVQSSSLRGTTTSNTSDRAPTMVEKKPHYHWSSKTEHHSGNVEDITKLDDSCGGSDIGNVEDIAGLDKGCSVGEATVKDSVTDVIKEEFRSALSRGAGEPGNQVQSGVKDWSPGEVTITTPITDQTACDSGDQNADKVKDTHNRFHEDRNADKVKDTDDRFHEDRNADKVKDTDDRFHEDRNADKVKNTDDRFHEDQNADKVKNTDDRFHEDRNADKVKDIDDRFQNADKVTGGPSLHEENVRLDNRTVTGQDGTYPEVEEIGPLSSDPSET